MDISAKKEELLSFLENLPSEKDSLKKSLSETEKTVTGITSFVFQNFEELHKAAGARFREWVINSFSPEVWSKYDILINPTEFKKPGPDDDGIYIAVTDGSVKTYQDAAVMVTYYGDVDLQISAGHARVMDTKHEVEASGWAEVSAMGHTRVIAEHMADLKLYDYARAVVDDAQLIYAAGNSYLESRGGSPRITVEENAQYLVSGGRPEIIHKEGARGVIGKIQDGKLSYGGDGMLFFLNQFPSIDLKHTGGDILLVMGYPSDEVKERFMDTIIPRKYQEQPSVGTCPQEPLPISVLQNDLMSFLKKADDSLKEAILGAKDEKEVAKVVYQHIPTLVNNGLDGKFLRDHFTFDALIQANIHVDEDAYHAYKPSGGDCQYIFGNQTVNSFGHPEKIVCYENTMLIANSNERQHVLNQNATAFGMGSANILALDSSKAFGADHSRIQAADDAFVVGLQSTTIQSRGDVQARVFDDATIECHDHGQIVLFHKASARASDECRIIAVGQNEITATGDVKVAQLAYMESSQPVFSEASEVKEAAKLSSEKELDGYLAQWEEEKTVKEAKVPQFKR